MYWGRSHPRNRSLTLDGPIQTAQRGEVAALLIALHNMWMHTLVFSDSKYVVDKFHRLIAGEKITHAQVHADLWWQIQTQCERLRIAELEVGVQWVPSHTSIDDVLSGRVSFEAHLLNNGADRLADQAAQTKRPSAELLRSISRQCTIAVHLQTFFLEVAKAREQARQTLHLM